MVQGKSPAAQAMPPKDGRNKMHTLSGGMHLNVYIKNTSKTWKYFALHLNDGPCSQAESFFSAVDRMPSENVTPQNR